MDFRAEKPLVCFSFQIHFKAKLYFPTTKKFSPQEKSCLPVINCLGICLGIGLLIKCLSSENLLAFKKDQPPGIAFYLFPEGSMLPKVKIQNLVLFHYLPKAKIVFWPQVKVSETRNEFFFFTSHLIVVSSRKKTSILVLLGGDQLSYLHVASSCGLGFLTTWRPRGSSVLQGEQPKNEGSRSQPAFSHLRCSPVKPCRSLLLHAIAYKGVTKVSPDVSKVRSPDSTS